jgi:hypothetical protein
MRRRPNPWIAVPALVLGVLAGVLGWIITDISCRVPEGGGGYATCPGWAAAVAILSFLVVTVGVAVILVLVYRSLAEWREKSGG